MGLLDSLGTSPTTTVKVDELYEVLKMSSLNWAQNTCLINGVKAHLPYSHILMMIGETDALMVPDEGVKEEEE